MEPFKGMKYVDFYKKLLFSFNSHSQINFMFHSFTCTFKTASDTKINDL